MSAPARLLSVRLQGFKSFAERTHVAFGPGISAVVGPNGSGKSNLADALRWALGEQGRALRTRKAEDVIWAGSERRPALGMADVQIVFDNADGLLPVEFGVVELGRRLFRSGENEYILNRQRVRLRDLVDLLDSAHLAENAFLFIGQGMVDQALALRPEERRPLFEEVAGVRRHDRRRRRAEEQLVESEANLARVEDVAAELRPQVRRLAAQAQQQASRRDAGDELAEALLLAAHARWHAAAARLAAAERTLAGGRSQLETAMAELATREATAGGLAERLSASAAASADARRELDAAREALTAARLDGGRAESEAAAVRQDLDRLAAERAGLEAGLVADRRAAAISVQGADPTLEHELRETEAALASASRELSEARSSTAAAAEDREAVRREEAIRAADLDLARRRLAELQRELASEAARAAGAGADRDAAATALAAAERSMAALAEDEVAARVAEERAAAAMADAAKAAATLAERRADGAGRLSATQGHLAALREAIEDERGGLGTAARSAGGQGLADGLVVDEARRPAVAAALGELAGGYVVGRRDVQALAGQRGTVVVREAVPDPGVNRDGRAGDPAATFGSVAAAAGGGLLEAALLADPSGVVAGLLARVAWVPDLEAALGLQGQLPPGWLLVTADGGAVVRGPAISLGPSDGLLERRAEAVRLQVAVDELTVAHTASADALAAAEAEVARASGVASLARDARTRLGERRRAAEAEAAVIGRRAEATAREAAWLEAQVARLGGAVERATATLTALESSATARPAAPPSAEAGQPRAAALAALERRIADLRASRGRLEAAWHAAESRRRDAERERARAEAAVAIAQQRLAENEASSGTLAAREVAAIRATEAARQAFADATAAVAAAGLAVDAVLERDADERRALGGAERAAAAAREQVQRLQDGARATEREELEARLSLESLREQLLVELAGLGDLGLRHLVGGTTGTELAITPPGAQSLDAAASSDGSADVARLEAALAAVAARWAADAPPDEAPSPGRLATLRRRFHELGAANPYALEEHAALAARLEGLETQRTDLIAAVDRTRTLIAELDTLIASQFRATFGLLERAFDARFRQLFGGGFAKLSLTEPGDLAVTGIEITARPPGKKPQALAMLSGGERALTAVALLFAMLEVRPVPFCVLDEVDAALDEANVGRFTDALRELGRTTQVIVITHNRGTIETADALYGVTVGDDSISHVISLRLEEATAFARESSDAASGDAAGIPRAPIIPAGLRTDELQASETLVAVEPSPPGEAAG